MHIRFVIYLLIAAILVIGGAAYGWLDVWRWILWALPFIAAGELGAWYKRRKHKNDV